MTAEPPPSPWSISRRIGSMRWDRLAVVFLMIMAIGVAARSWLQDNPGHNPWAPLDLRDEPGWATPRKLLALRDDPAQCRAVLERSDVAFTALNPAGEGPCRRDDRTVLPDYPLSPAAPPTTCPVAAAMEVWLARGVQPAARDLLGQNVTRIEHLGSYSCRRLYGGADGPWSEHTTGNAIDISAFVLADGSRISVLSDWSGDDKQAAFLRRARDASCEVFATVLSPDYNEAHADHFHLDQKGWGFAGVCR